MCVRPCTVKGMKQNLLRSLLCLGRVCVEICVVGCNKEPVARRQNNAAHGIVVALKRREKVPQVVGNLSLAKRGLGQPWTLVEHKPTEQNVVCKKNPRRELQQLVVADKGIIVAVPCGETVRILDWAGLDNTRNSPLLICVDEDEVKRFALLSL